MLEDKLLIWKFNRGNYEALRSIYEKYKDDLVTLAAALLIDVASAEDVVHDVFVSVFPEVPANRKPERLFGDLRCQ
jgi:DNA-directed RNA polymerase specialized sigma24 family protein